ncbi:MAG: restriction endonuclease subunit S [Prevotellaceae bacterium]|nr:restriction endonuclease subunit S [Prevotellaceae bacterium]
MHLSPTELAQKEIPIPSLSEQSRIVSILDTFTSSISNLKQQIEERRKQYEYERDLLLDLEGKEGVEMKKLGEVGDICMCKRIMKDQTSEKGDIPFFKIGTFGGKADAYISRELFEDYKEKYSYPKKGEILISAAGTIGRTVVFNGEDAYFQDSNIVWISNNEQLVLNTFLRYLYGVIDWKIDGGTIKRLYNYNLKNATIYVPTLQAQSRIVSILDTFEQSISNLEEQLAMREKQYEYYRNQLLTFEGEEERGKT